MSTCSDLSYPVSFSGTICFKLVFSFPLVSLDGILQDIRSLERGMEMTKKEFLVQDDSPVLKEFIKTNSEQLDSLIKDSKTAQVGLL